jgi:hypothetical protein
MPRTKATTRTSFPRLVVFAFLGWALLAFRGSGRDAVERIDGSDERTAAGALAMRRRTRGRRRRLASSLAFATLFFAGAALSAGAGDMIAGAIDDTTPSTDTTPTTDTTTTTEDPAADPADTVSDETTPPEDTPAENTEPGGETPPADDGTIPDDGATDPGTVTDPADDGSEPPATEPEDGDQPEAGDPVAGSEPGSDGPKKPKGHRSGPPIVTPHPHEDDADLQPLDPETLFGGSTIWLHRTMPDPTPPAKRLAPAWASMLRFEARANDASWAAILGVLRANGRSGRRPAAQARVHALATRLSGIHGDPALWQAFLAMSGKTTWADQAQALTRYNRAVTLRGLVRGLDASKERLARKLLNDRRITIYPGGRSDLWAGRIDIRVIVLIRYLAAAHGQVTVSSLKSGHRMYSRPGVISAHMYGLAVDIAVLANQPIYGHQAPGGITEQAVRNILLLPAELRPRQVISLLGLGGPSFPLADHDDHIHVGF